MSTNARLYILVGLSFVLAIAGSIVPLTGVIEPFRPAWPALVLLFWTLHYPHRVGITTAWLVGLFLDVIHGGLLGQYPLALAVLAYLALRLHQRIVVFPLWQQAISVGTLLAIYMTIILWIDGMTGRAPGSWLYWLPLLTSSLFWPVVHTVLTVTRRLLRIY